jgi:hypothetical protein
MPLRLRSAFDTYWGEANRFSFERRDVVLKLDMKVMRRGTLPPDDAPRHRIVIRHVPKGAKGEKPPGADDGTANVDYRPREHSAQGNWTDHFGIDRVYAQEFGHLLGLRDEYPFVDRNGGWKRAIRAR